jgi:hypothetical protein
MNPVLFPKNAMNDDIERLLSRLTPRGAGPPLRPRVLAAVAGELQAAKPSPWLRRAALGVAASLLVGIALNVYVSTTADRRLAQLLGPPPAAGRNAERMLAEYNDVLQQLIAESQNPALTPRPAATPRGEATDPKNRGGFMLNGDPARPTTTASCC